ncbi:mediator of RNA polymerase II transcription subunit 28-like [Pyrus ussuriensis x Pyrus communis]|uniref:Mediator of RNA polymerase II transcription subunit 28-like n=1 Tax=Pyrus ussuriensis x Pyrus communis TaxID=2448454 RepID=A0A5N5I729_9ROSA|nr:mediator of RNA polymerase II transcription subunit 28-like [Pyrus ussuriensis x Pyrus communis]
MAERQAVDQQQQSDAQMQSPTAPREDMVSCVMALEAALLPCLPAKELQAIDRSPHPSHQTSFLILTCTLNDGAPRLLPFCFAFLLMVFILPLQLMWRGMPETLWKLPKSFNCTSSVCNEIDAMEEELRIKTEIIKKHERLIQGWKKELKDHLDKHNTELERV